MWSKGENFVTCRMSGPHEMGDLEQYPLSLS